MNRLRYAHDAVYSRIATSLLYFGLVYVNQGKLEEPFSMDQENLLMKRAIYEHYKAHAEIAASLNNKALVYKGRGKLIEAIQFTKKVSLCNKLFMVQTHRILVFLHHLPL